VLTTNVIDRSSSPAADFNILLSSPVNLAGATVTARVYVASSNRPAEVIVHLDDTTDDSSTGTYRSTTVPASGWFEADISPSSSSSSLSNTNLIGLVISGFAANGSVVVYLDSIVVTGASAGPWQFTSSGSPLTFEPDPGTDPSDISGSISWRGP
jgi:hypothetical protein